MTIYSSFPIIQKSPEIDHKIYTSFAIIFKTSVFSSAKTSTDSVQDATASETDPSAPGIAGRKQDTGKVDPSAPGSNKRKTTKKLRRGAKKYLQLPFDF